jgi:hypothetical protein
MLRDHLATRHNGRREPARMRQFRLAADPLAECGARDCSTKVQFRDAPCIAIEKHVVTRGSLIKYVANTRGGVHYSPSWRSKSADPAFRALDTINALGWEVLRLPFVAYELFSTAEAILTSMDVRTLANELDVLKSTAEEFRARREKMAPP